MIQFTPTEIWKQHALYGIYAESSNAKILQCLGVQSEDSADR